MCGRFTITTRPELLEERFGAKVEENIQPRYNAAPSQKLPVILNTEPDKIQMIQWGLIPPWLRTLPGKSGLINVRAESFLEKQTFDNDLEHRRCLILADGFYEWKRGHDKKKIPHRITLKNEEPFAFAGIWEENETKEGEKIKTFAIITTEPNEIMKSIHNRMPVILPKTKEKPWLTIEEDYTEDLKLLVPFAGRLTTYEVSTKVNNAKTDSADMIKPYRQYV